MIEFWWCCLNPRERNLVLFLLPRFAFVGSYIKQDDYNLYWAVQGYLPNNAMVVFFQRTYGLTPGTIDDGEGGTIPVYFFDLSYWSQVTVFSHTDAFICAQPCKILRFSVMH